MKTNLNVYICLSCTQVKTTATFPSSDGCKKNAFHRWRKLGQEGKQCYYCWRCGTTVNLNVQPVAVGCPVATLHEWEKQ